MKKYVLILAILLASCISNTQEQVKKIHTRMSSKQLMTIMGTPFKINVYPNKEEWEFLYDYNTKFRSRMMILNVTIVNDSIIDFNSY
jgi:outer membrane protein assembly factor BamE (lipoprotein component of BamABCDE complex)